MSLSYDDSILMPATQLTSITALIFNAIQAFYAIFEIISPKIYQYCTVDDIGNSSCVLSSVYYD